MKNIFIALLTFAAIVFCFNNCNAQNYQPFNPHKGSNYYNYSKYLYGVRFDSSALAGNDSLFYFYHTFEDTTLSHNGQGCVFNGKGKSWMGSKMIMRNNGYYIFDNRFNDSIYINAEANNGDSWTFYRINNETTISASVISISNMTFNSFTDFVKIIQLNETDTAGHTIPSVWNKKTIWLSKNHGFLKMPSFYTFPVDTIAFCKNHFPGYLTNEWYNNHEIGDETDFTTQVDDYNMYEHGDYSIRKYIDKQYNTDSSKVTYIIFNYQVNYGGYPQKSYSSLYYDTVTTNVNSDKTPFLSDDTAWTMGGTTISYFDSCYQTVVSTSVHADYRLCDTTNYYFSDREFSEPCGSSYISLFGIGTLTDYGCEDPTFGNSQSFINYYKKGNYECGRSLLSVKSVSESSVIKVFPNPTSGLINVDLSAQSSRLRQVSIVSVYGAIEKIISVSGGQSNRTSIDIGNLPDGLYILQIDLGDKLVYRKIIKAGGSN